ncbi:MAG: gamma-glutamyl-gamma-aminobutyrate hydrolase family protein, partial [Planctomycetota bacterium]|nr:gamma-glutamyl-gamma-aminobutyrate hydrolase family protein [Planctomycetota bacterium]
AILVPGGFGIRGTEGKVLAVQHAREHKVPFFGICLGLQMAVIEFGRHVLGLEKANSLEFDEQSPHPVVTLMEAQKAVSDKGGTMRLGQYTCALKDGTKARELYGAEVIQERHRHRFEFNNSYRQQFEAASVVFAGLSPDGKLVEIIELKDHPFFVGTQFHPEFRSRPTLPHPLFKGFIAAALRHQEQKSGKGALVPSR